MLLGLTATAIPMFGQTFRVDQRPEGIGYFANRDGSLTVAYEVNLSQSNGLFNVVPFLESPSCATYAGRQIFNITYLGHGASRDTLSQDEISVWHNNTSQTVWFNVHMFDNNIMCPSTAAATLAAECLTFQLAFSFEGTQQRVPVGLDTQQLLTFGNPPTNGVQVVDVLWDTDPRPRVEGLCQLYTQDFQVLVTDQGVNAAQVANDNNRIYYGINWSLNIDTPQGQFSWRSALEGISIPLSNSFSRFDLGRFILQETVDLIPENTQIFDTDQTLFPLAPLGGSGTEFNAAECDRETYNFWDVTDLEFENGTVRDGIGQITGLRTLTVDKFSLNISYRSSALYVVNLNGCASSSAFGTDSDAESMAFTRYQLDDQGNASVTVDVPSTLKSGGNLAEGYTIEWFFRSHNNFAKVTPVVEDPDAAQALSTTLQVPVTLADAGQIVAQITHTASNSVVSVVSPAHGFEYDTLPAFSFMDGEVQDDGALQVGETVEQNLSFTNRTGADLTDVTFTLSREGGSGAQFGFGTDQSGIQSQSCAVARTVLTTNVTAGQTVSTNLWIKKFFIEGDCNANSNYRFAITTAYELNGTSHSYTQHFEVTPGCADDNPHNIDLDGLIAYWGTCPTGGVRFPIFGQGTYSYRWFDSAASLCFNSPEAGVTTDFWDVPDLTQTGFVYVEVLDVDTGLQRIYPFRVIVFDNLPTQAEFLPSWREETVSDVDLDNDGVVTVLDSVIFFSAGGCD